MITPLTTSHAPIPQEMIHKKYWYIYFSDYEISLASLSAFPHIARLILAVNLYRITTRAIEKKNKSWVFFATKF